MEIWLILNGKRSGPYPDYEIRSRIEHGQMELEDKVWHEGLAEWTPVGELELFKKSFPEKKTFCGEPLDSKRVYMTIRKTADLNDDTLNNVAEPKPKAHFGRRFWARWMDLTGYSALWWLGMYLGGRDIGAAIGNPWLLLTMYLPWFALEAWMIQRFGRTPGKWLMGLRVTNEDGSALAFAPSVWRALRVLVTGVGFGWGLISVLCQTMSWFTAKRLGKPIWDHIGKHKVTAEPLSPFRTGALVLLFFAAAQLQMAVRGPYEEKIMAEAFPQFKEYFEREGKMYFPVKEKK